MLDLRRRRFWRLRLSLAHQQKTPGIKIGCEKKKKKKKTWKKTTRKQHQAPTWIVESGGQILLERRWWGNEMDRILVLPTGWRTNFPSLASSSKSESRSLVCICPHSCELKKSNRFLVISAAGFAGFSHQPILHNIPVIQHDTRWHKMIAIMKYKAY